MITAFSLLKRKTSFVRLYVYAIAGLTLVGMLDFLISFIFNITLLDYRFTEYGGHDFIFTGLTAYHEQKFLLSSFEMPRYSYFLNRPGTYVFFSFWALIFNHLFVRSSKAENIILIGGILTASFYFFITALLWIFLFRLRNSKRSIFLAYPYLLSWVLRLFHLFRHSQMLFSFLGKKCLPTCKYRFGR